MRRVLLSLLVLLPTGTGLWGCSDRETAPGSSFEVNVAPLSLPGISGACYGINVNNGDGDPVWSRTKLCSGQFGNGAGGDISYVGPCDADSPAHTVTLFLESLTGADGQPLGAEDWQNPCAAPTGCPRTVACVENADTPVVFNITVMRRANQGFFDLAIDFEDVFCSGKVDCVGTDDQPIELLHNRDGQRDQTVVVALACTGGPGEGDETTIHMNDIRIECADPLAPRYIPQAEASFGACFETQSGAMITSHGIPLSVFAVTPDPGDPLADPTVDEIYWRALSYNAVFDPNGSPTWNPDLVTVVPTATGPTEGLRTFEVGAVYTRLGPQTALVAYLDHTPDYAPSGPDLGAITAIHLGVATLNPAGDTWQSGTLLEIPGSLAPNIDFPVGMADGRLLVQSFDGAAMALYVIAWDAGSGSFGVPALVSPPLGLTMDDLEIIDFRDGHLLAALANQNPGAVTPLVASAETGWDLTALGLPANTTVPMGAVFAAWEVTALLDQHTPHLLHGGRVVVKVKANEPSPGTGSAELLAWFVPDGGGAWDFEVHPIYTEYLALIGPPSGPMQASDPRGYQHHIAFTMTGGNPQQMVRVYARDSGGDITWQRYDGLAGRGSQLRMQSVIGVIERPGLPALAAFAFQREGGSTIELELGMVQGEIIQNELDLDERVMTPLVALTIPNPTMDGWELSGVERGRDGRLLVSFRRGGSGDIYTWRVTVSDGPTPTATAALVGLTSSELIDVEPIAAGAFGVDIELEPGDGTQASVPGGCADLASFVSRGGAVGGTPGLGTTETAYLQYLGGFDFEAAPSDDGSGGPTYDVRRIPYGATNEAIMAAALNPLFNVDGEYRATLRPSGIEGNQWDARGIPLSDPVWQQSVFAGQESLSCSGEPCNKVYYNTAIGFDATVPNCWLRWEATASGGTGVDSTGTIAPGFVYPVISGDVQLTGADPAADGLLCTQHPLGSNGMAILYSQPDMTGLQFCYSWDGQSLVENLGADVPCESFMSED